MLKLSPQVMMKATKLTKSGKLMEATALIQNMLGRIQPVDPAHDAKNVTLSERSDKRPVTTVPTRLLSKHANPKHDRNIPAERFESKTYRSADGQLSYKLFTPSAYKGKKLPLIVMLHGCSQSPDDFASGTDMNTVAEETGFLVAYPAQAASANAMGCWNWFKSSDQQKDSGEPALIAGMVEQIKAEYAINEKMVYVAGMSAGGAMAAILGMTHPELFAAIGVHSGLPCGAATSMMGGLTAMKHGGGRVTASVSARPVPTIVFHGDNDRTVNRVNSDDVIAQFDSKGAFDRSTTETGRSEGGMDYSRSVYLQEDGSPLFEQWVIHGAGHAWSGGNAKGSFTEPRGPNASRELIRFFFEHELLQT